MLVSPRNGMRTIERVGTRTQDLRIKSPLLYRLSYALAIQTAVWRSAEVSDWTCKFQFAFAQRLGLLCCPNQWLGFKINVFRFDLVALLNYGACITVPTPGKFTGVGWHAVTVHRS